MRDYSEAATADINCVVQGIQASAVQQTPARARMEEAGFHFMSIRAVHYAMHDIYVVSCLVQCPNGEVKPFTIQAQPGTNVDPAAAWLKENIT